MARGHKDYGDGGQVQIIHPVTDLGEAVVRLGSPVTFQRSGNVIWFNKLNRSLESFFTNKSGTNDDIYTSTVKTYNHGGCLAVKGGSVDGEMTSIWKNFPHVRTARFGFEIKLRPSSPNILLYFFLRYYTGTEYIRGLIRCDFENGIIEYLDGDGNYQTAIETEDLSSEMSLYHQVKFVIDIEQEVYGSLWWNEQEIDLSAVSLKKSAASDLKHLTMDIMLKGQTAGNPICHFNDWIFTINEP